tara:strand:+ start:332 stop:1342 length:1011 start_codon:yes stop_codon:yes gene_type:complete
MIDIISPMIKQFLPFAQERMGFKDPPKLFLRGDAQNANNPLGKTAFYDPQAKAVTLYITDRHPKDVMRSLSHELVHHSQNCRGDFNDVGEMGEGYAQNDEHLREMEREAYETGNMCFRDWEDSIKSTIYFEQLQKGANNTMSTKEWKNGELTTLISEAFGFKFNLDHLTEERTGSGIDHGGDDDEEAKEETEGKADSKREEEGLDEEQGYNARLDDTLGAKHGKKSQSEKDREHESEGEEEALGHHKYASDKQMNEDSGEDEAWHDWKNEHADDDHISEIEHHLRALKHDRDHDRDESEYDDDKYEDEGYNRHDESLSAAQIQEVARRVVARLRKK